MQRFQTRVPRLFLKVHYHGTQSKVNTKKNFKLSSNVGAPTRFSYGEFGGLKKNDEKDTRYSANLSQKIQTFEELKLLPVVRNAVKNLIKQEANPKDSKNEWVSRPSPVQIVTVKKISKVLMDEKLSVHAIAAETGSGKTLAYLMPLLDYLKRTDMDSGNIYDGKYKGSIRSIILVPTYELVQQVFNTIDKVSNVLNIKAFQWGSQNTSYQDLLDNINNGIDIMVTTPFKLMNLFSIRKISRPDFILSRVEFLIIDEADTLFDKSWIEPTQKCIKMTHNVKHLIFCSATIPQQFNKSLTKIFPNVVPITTSRLHKVPYTIDFKTIDCSISPFKGSKIKALAQVLYAISNDNTEPGLEKRCIVFVNEKKDIPYVVNKLKETYNYDAIAFTGEISSEERSLVLGAFVSPPRAINDLDPNSQQHSGKKEASDLSSVENKRQKKVPESNIVIPGGPLSQSRTQKIRQPLKILVCTDVLSRGLNFKAVKNVILYDVPQTAVDLLHRVGRTGRMKQRGRVFLLIDKKTKSWARGLPKAVKKNMTLQ